LGINPFAWKKPRGWRGWLATCGVEDGLRWGWSDSFLDGLWSRLEARICINAYLINAFMHTCFDHATTPMADGRWDGA